MIDSLRKLARDRHRYWKEIPEAVVLNQLILSDLGGGVAGNNQWVF